MTKKEIAEKIFNLDCFEVRDCIDVIDDTESAIQEIITRLETEPEALIAWLSSEINHINDGNGTDNINDILELIIAINELDNTDCYS